MKQFALIGVLLGALAGLGGVSALAQQHTAPATQMYHQESSIRAVHTAQGYRLITPALPATSTR